MYYTKGAPIWPTARFTVFGTGQPVDPDDGTVALTVYAEDGTTVLEGPTALNANDHRVRLGEWRTYYVTPLDHEFVIVELKGEVDGVIRIPLRRIVPLVFAA